MDDIRERAHDLLAQIGTRMYGAGGDWQVLLDALDAAKDLCFELNALRPSQKAERRELLEGLLGSLGEHSWIQSPFWCDYGLNIHIGDACFFNHGVTVLDCAEVTFGDRVFVAPGCVFATAAHPIHPTERAAWLEYFEPIVVEDDVWIGANVTVLPGVTIGRGSTIGAGSVVTRDVPPGVVAVGNPCRVLREVTEADLNTRELFVSEAAGAES